MQRTTLAFLLALAGVVSVSQTADACGDKFLLVGRGVRFQPAYASLNPGHVIVYARPSMSAKAAIRDPQLHKRLRQAGHAVSVIENHALLVEAFRSASPDLVLADVNEGNTVAALAAASPSKPVVLFVEYPAAVERSPALQQKYLCELKPKDRAPRYLEAIENAMKGRPKTQRAQQN